MRIRGILLILFLSSLPAQAGVSVTWSETKIHELLCPGFQIRKTIAFTSSVDISGVAVAIVPALIPLVSVSPASLQQIRQGQTYSLALTISVPQDNPIGTIYKGTIRLTVGKKTIAVPESITIEVEDACAQIADQAALVRDSNGFLFPVNEIIVDFNPNVTKQQASATTSAVGGIIVGFVPSTNAYQIRVPATTITELDSFILSLIADPAVENAFKNYTLAFTGLITDLDNLRVCNAARAAPYDRSSFESAWNFLEGHFFPGSERLVGIIDSGVNKGHQEFNDPHVDVIGDDETSSDGHGTSVAGIIGANNVPVPTGTCTPSSTANQMTGVLGGVPGLNYGLRMRGGSALWGIFYFDQFIDTLATQGASAINVSWGTTAPAPGLTSYMQEHMQAHPEILFVLAAGNQGVDASLVTPANIKLPNTVTIAATTTDDRRAIFNAPFTSDWFTQCLNPIQSPDAAICSSNYGTVVDIAAPGINILAPAAGCSGDPNSCYTLSEGTSFSTPMVTGAAAILQTLGAGDPSSVKYYLTASGDPILTDKLIGGRRLNVFCAVQLVLPPPPGLIMSDDFSEGYRDCSRWFTTVEPPGIGSMAVANQQLDMVKAGSRNGYMGLASRCKVAGNFDVQVHYTLSTWPAQNLHTVRLMASDLPDGGTGFPGVYRNSYADENYQFRNPQGAAGLVSVPTSDFSGTIGLKRVGQTLFGNGPQGTIGSAPVPTDPTGFTIDFAGPSITAPGNVAIEFDDFKVITGTVVCPQ